MKLYTRTGDKGQTRLIGNRIVKKDDHLVEAYGTIDELNSYVGILLAGQALPDQIRQDLSNIQQLLFDCGTDIANADAKIPYRTTTAAVKWLEERIDSIEATLPPIESFILPGGTLAASQLQFARTIARRAERRWVSALPQANQNPEVLKFLNRLSDYFFASGRYLNYLNQVEEPTYIRSGKVFR